MATVETIFAEIAKHVITGLMIHDQYESYYAFLNMPKYAECHREQYEQESDTYSKLKHYYMCMHDKLIQELPIENPKTIPSSWYNYKRIDVDANTKRNAVKDGLENWMDWEADTKSLYESKYKELIDLGEIEDAQFVKHMIKNVSCELSKIKEWYIMKKDCDFSIASILEDQK